MDQGRTTTSGRAFDRGAFDAAYRERVLGNSFFEEPRYYRIQMPRYRNTLRLICSLPLPAEAEVLEVGGGQISLLWGTLFGGRTAVADRNPEYAKAVIRHGVSFVACDLLHDDIAEHGRYDLVVLCEVVEHLPVPLHLVLEKVRLWLKPGGYVFVTTPNLNRLRNVVRLAQGHDIFCPLFYPAPGGSIGHPFEFSAPVLRWQIERAGFEEVVVRHEQLSLGGFSPAAWLGRNLLAPLLMARPVWRDSLVAWGRRPAKPEQEPRSVPREATYAVRAAALGGAAT